MTNSEAHEHHSIEDDLNTQVARLDYEEAWQRLFPILPKEGWYWHTHKGYPIYISQRDGCWWSTEIMLHSINVETELLTPGLYEQLLRIESYVSNQQHSL